MAILHIILWHDAFVDDFFLGHKVYRIGLLEQGISHVFLISEHFAYYRAVPLFLSCGSLNLLLLQVFGYLSHAVAFQIKAENQFHNLCLLRYNDQIPFFIFGVSHKFVMIDNQLAVFKFSDHTPSGILTDVAALFLCKAA